MILAGGTAVAVELRRAVPELTEVGLTADILRLIFDIRSCFAVVPFPELLGIRLAIIVLLASWKALKPSV